MKITEIVQRLNRKLAGEMLSYEADAKYLFDDVIDDINGALNSKFPTFSEFTPQAYPTKYPDYDFFPDKYIRSVVVSGAATKFYTIDEEGISASPVFEMEYKQNLFRMVRDYSESVPEDYQEDSQGYLTPSEETDENPRYTNYSENFML